MAMRAFPQFPRLERFSMLCRWTFAFVSVLGGIAFAIWMGRLAMQAHSSMEIIWVGAVGICLVLAGLSYVRRRLLFPATYLLAALMLSWLASLLYEMSFKKAPVTAVNFPAAALLRVNPGTIFAAALLSVTSILHLVSLHKARKRPHEAFSFWWWMGPRN